MKLNLNYLNMDRQGMAKPGLLIKDGTLMRPLLCWPWR